MNLNSLIESAELKYKQILEDFFISVYDEKSLSSHGIYHHRRVWRYAKELTVLLPAGKTTSDSQLPSKLIIASYLHDIGMSVETGESHGKYSRDLCIDFLDKNHLPADDYTDVLEAIANHDKKDYQGNIAVNVLLTILSVADDLDAFGFTGIYRYSEIYLVRGVSRAKIGDLILANAARRFDHFIRNFGSSDKLVQKQKKRYDILIDFFNNYNRQVQSYSFSVNQPAGYCGVLELFLKMIENKKEPEELLKEADKQSFDEVIRWFLNGLKTELH
jgi:hypothetical protein